jgi:hypothetical protein
VFEEYSVANSVALCRRDVDFVALVMFARVADVVAACFVWRPCLADSRMKVSLNLAAEGHKWMGVVIVGAPKVSVSDTVGQRRAGRGRSWHQR